MNLIKSIESLRGLACLIVLFYHYPSSSYLFIQNGLLAVYFFFSLSGFVITLNYFYKIKKFSHLLRFQYKRFLRLYPVHIFVLFLVLGIQTFKFIIIDFYQINSGKEAFTPNEWFTLKDFVQHIFLTQSVTNLGYHLSWNGAAWSVSVEFYTYIFFAAITLMTRNNKNLYILIIISFLYFFNDLIFLRDLFHEKFLDCLRYFFLGSIFYFIYEKIKFRISDISLLIIISVSLFLNNKGLIDLNFLFSVLIISIAALKNESLVNRILSLKIFVFLGTISYSLYMIHFSILYLYIQFLKFGLKIKFKEENLTTAEIGVPIYDTLITVSYTGISIIVAIILYNYIENKFRQKNLKIK